MIQKNALKYAKKAVVEGICKGRHPWWMVEGDPRYGKERCGLITYRGDGYQLLTEYWKEEGRPCPRLGEGIEREGREEMEEREEIVDITYVTDVWEDSAME